jgi:imidazolonepropionase-like amidohydrolase
MKRYLILTSALLIFLSIPYIDIAQKYTAIVGATLIKTQEKGTIANSYVLLKDSIIYQIGTWNPKKVKFPANTTIIDASDKYIIPGMVDAHIHFFQSGGLYTRPDGLDLTSRVPYKDELAWIRANIDDCFSRYIRCGITSVVDLGGPMWNFDIRDHANKSIVAPRVFICGPLIASYQPKALTTDEPPIIKVNNIEEALKLVDEQIKMNTDFIKIWYVNPSRGRDLDITSPENFYPIVEAIIKEAKKYNKPVYVHAYELDETVKRALKAGADVLVHSVKDKEVDEEFIKLAKQNKISYIPTLWVFSSYESVYSKKIKLTKQEQLLGNPHVIASYSDMYDLADSEIDNRIKKYQADPNSIEPSPIIMKNLKKVYDNGINICAGTDAGNVGVIHGPSLYREFLMMRKAGMSNRDIIVSATLNPAKMLRKDKQLGSIEIGKLADIVVLNSNPLDTILNCADIFKVIKNGNVFETDKIIKNSPENIAQIQLNAYNSRDLESFLSVYSDDVEIYQFPDSLMNKGKDQMRQLYANFFSRATSLHCRLVNRITYNDYVIDREEITTNIPGRGRIQGQAIYKIENGLIRKVWFIK